MSVTVLRPPQLGSLGEALVEALAYITSPARIDWEIAWLTQQIALGDTSAETRVQLSDWKAIWDRQRELLREAA